jgi:hypothetical protein
LKAYKYLCPEWLYYARQKLQTNVRLNKHWKVNELHFDNINKYYYEMEALKNIKLSNEQHDSYTVRLNPK